MGSQGWPNSSRFLLTRPPWCFPNPPPKRLWTHPGAGERTMFSKHFQTFWPGSGRRSTRQPTSARSSDSTGCTRRAPLPAESPPVPACEAAQQTQAYTLGTRELPPHDAQGTAPAASRDQVTKEIRKTTQPLTVVAKRLGLNRAAVARHLGPYLTKRGGRLVLAQSDRLPRPMRLSMPTVPIRSSSARAPTQARSAATAQR